MRKNKEYFLDIAAKKLFRVFREEGNPAEYGFVERVGDCGNYALYACIFPRNELDTVYTTPYYVATLPRTARGLRKEVKRLRRGHY